jgi:hypothetical protein
MDGRRILTTNGHEPTRTKEVNAEVSVCDMKARERRKQEKPFEMT